MRAARAAAVHAPLLASPLIGRGVEHLVVGRIHDELGGAGVVIDEEDTLPVQPAVGRLEDAAFAARRPQIAERRDVDDIEVHGIDDDARDLLAGAQPHVAPRLAAIRRLVDAVAPGRALAIVVLAGADPDQVGIGWPDGDVADRKSCLDRRRRA